MKARGIIKFLQNAQFRIIDIKEINSILKENRENTLLKKLFYKIFNEKFPIFKSFSLKDLTNADTDNVINWFCIDENIKLGKDKTVQERFEQVLSEKNGKYREIFRDKQISCAEAYFYLDLFRGNKFGFGYKQLKQLLFQQDFVKFNADFSTPSVIDIADIKINDKNLPIFIQEFAQGSRFKAIIENNKFEVIRSDNKFYTHKFNVFNKLIPFLPDKKIYIEFVLESFSTEEWDKVILNSKLVSNEKLKNCGIVILDMYAENDKTPLSKRLSRIKKLLEKSNISRIRCISYKKVEDKKNALEYIEKLTNKKGAVVIKNDTDFTDKGLKTQLQFNKETMVIKNYTMKPLFKTNYDQKGTSVKRAFQLDTIVCKNKLNKEVIITNFSMSVQENIQNLVGTKIGVDWQVSQDGKLPIAQSIEKYDVLI